MFYTVIIILGLLCVAAMLVLVRFSNPGTKGKMNQWFHSDSSQECWNQLINVEVPMDVYDITCLTSNCLIILFSVLSVIAAHKRKEHMIYAAGCPMTLTAVILMLNTCLMVGQYQDSHDVPDSSRISEEVGDQLQYSMDMYNNNYPDIKRSWDNTMKDGCCCGLHSYKDLLELGMEIPVFCKCISHTTRRYGYENETCYGNADIFCDNVPEYNVTSRGCLRYIMTHIQHDRKQIHVAKMITFMSVTAVQLILVILAMIFTFRSVFAPAKESSDNSNGNVKFALLVKPAEAKEDVSSDAA